MIKTYIGLHVKYLLFLSDVKCDFNFLYRYSKNIQISNFMKILTVGSELFLAEGRTDIMKLQPLLRILQARPNKKERQ